MKLGSPVFTPSCEYDAIGEYSQDDHIYWKLWLNFHSRTSTLINELARDWIIGQGHLLAWVSMKRPMVMTKRLVMMKRLATITERLAATIKRAVTRSPAWSHVTIIEHARPSYTTPPPTLSQNNSHLLLPPCSLWRQMLNNRIKVHSEDSAVRVFNGGDVDNPLMVSGYVDEIFDYMKKNKVDIYYILFQ